MNKETSDLLYAQLEKDQCGCPSEQPLVKLLVILFKH
jgi:hypothetical protein